jgi:osmoprotectant transport system substrate-binding protein
MDRAKILCIILAAAAFSGCSGTGPPVVRVGSKNFTEQILLGEVIAQHLEERLGVRVERNLNLGGTLLAHQALVSGQIDLYPEYTGTALAAILDEPAATDPVAVRERVRSGYEHRFKVQWLDPLGIDNGFAMVVRKSSASTLSDAARRAQPWLLGVGYEFEQRRDGLEALRKTYGLQVSGVKTMDLGLLFKALEDGQVDMIAANATDGLLSKPGFQVLEDNKHAFPPYEIGIAVRQDALTRIPKLGEALAELSGKFSNDAMRRRNYLVDVEHVPIRQAASGFLRQAGL